MRSVLTGIVLTAMITPALAADPVASNPILSPEPIAERDDLIIWLGVGVGAEPDYEGSDDYEFTVFPIVDLDLLRLPRLGTFGQDTNGFSIGPSFNVVGGRDASDNAALAGLGDVDFAFELGLEAEYRADYWRVFAAGRYGLGGHNGLTGEVGFDAILHPTQQLTLIAGPRVTFADDEYFDTYYSVTPAQAAASAAAGVGLPAFNASGGIKSYGVEAEAIYQITEDWRAHLRGGYFRMAGDAEDSPLVAIAGDENQFFVGAGFSRRIALDLFD